MRFPAIVLLSLPLSSRAWFLHPFHRSVAKLRAKENTFSPFNRGVIILKAGPFFGPEEEFDCGDEEECEIDWSLMPGEEEDNEEDYEEEKDIDMQPQQSFGNQAKPASIDKSRVRLEMNWQIDECETNEDSCSDYCIDCAGSGRQACRFCRGTGLVSFGNEFRPCLICSDGTEECSSCRGTGRIAPWASTMTDHLKSEKGDSSNFI